ncbi:hypothetical protein NDU88_005974 [Pleurodeles waltl]|uniref:Uncharacterized protein n=1 Tax=Pleurodeles waltl TaxID=8319 RepID=A0AAV7MCK1_PLEWA|nr:hypothetical protein NDU88_005974 [Pleurodeles waltl]
MCPGSGTTWRKVLWSRCYSLRGTVIAGPTCSLRRTLASYTAVHNGDAPWLPGSCSPDIAPSWRVIILKWARVETRVLRALRDRGQALTGYDTWDALVAKLEAQNYERPP